MEIINLLVTIPDTVNSSKYMEASCQRTIHALICNPRRFKTCECESCPFDWDRTDVLKQEIMRWKEK